ncbi:hypothetical protein ACJJTC_002090 [Scirpophaga incertulas]
MILRSRKVAMDQEAPPMAQPATSALSAEQREERSYQAPLQAPPISPQDTFARPSPLITSHNSRITHRSHASKSTVLAQQLSLKAQHARRIAELEAAREQAELTRRAADRELNIAELELQADLAAAEAASSLHSSRSTRAKVVSWLDCNDHNININLRSQVNDSEVGSVATPEREAGSIKRRLPYVNVHQHAFKSLESSFSNLVQAVIKRTNHNRGPSTARVKKKDVRKNETQDFGTSRAAHPERKEHPMRILQ